jgi:hypothetical protein
LPALDAMTNSDVTTLQAGVVRSKIHKLLRAAPFRPFALSLENGDRVVIGHLENFAHDPPAGDGTSGSEDFCVISKKLRLFSTFGAVTNVALVDRGEVAR